MAESSLPPSLASVNPPLDEGLRCLNCGYNLTGLTETRCPECGSVFDAEALRATLAGRSLPVPGWDDGTTWWLAFLGTCWRTWFAPTRFGEMFPGLHARGSGLLFRILCLAAAVVIYLSLLVLTWGQRSASGDDLLIVLAIPPGVMVGALGCELMLALVFTLCMRRKGLHFAAGGLDAAVSALKAFISWRGLTGFFRSFLIISAVLITPCFMLPSRAFDGSMSRVAVLAAVIWWWICLYRGVTAAAWPGVGRIVALLLLPVVTVLAIGLGFAVSFVSGFILMACFATHF